MGISTDFYEVVARNVAKYRDTTVVIKFGGELVEQDNVLRNLLTQAITLKNFGAQVILVHGGGKQIDHDLEKEGIVPRKNEGRRDTDLATLEITHRCLNDLNRKIVTVFHAEAHRLRADVSAIGLGGNDSRLIIAEPYWTGSDTRTGKVKSVDQQKILGLAKHAVPIFHPVCAGLDGGCFNVNADDVAAAIAIGVKANRLILCSNIPGVLDHNKQKISELSVAQIDALIEDGTISGGMIAKIRAAGEVAANANVGGVVILDGANPEAIQSELLTDTGAGTLIRKTGVPSISL